MKGKRDKLGMVDGAKSLNRVLLSSVSEMITTPDEKPVEFTRSALSYHLQKRREQQWVSVAVGDADELH